MKNADPSHSPGDALDEHTLHMATQKDDFAWRLIARRVHRRVVMILGRSSQDAADVTQIACENIMRALRSNMFRVQEHGSAEAWVVKIASNASIDQLRRDKRTAMHFSPDDDVVDVAEESQPSLDEKMTLDEALDTLSNAHRVVIVLYIVDKLTYKEIAEQLGIPENTVKSRVSRAVAKLRMSRS